MKWEVLGLPVDGLTRSEVLNKLLGWIKEGQRQKFVVTAYSEFFVLAKKDKQFADAIRMADLVTPDGISVLAACDYLKRSRGKSVWRKLWMGLETGRKVIKGKLGETVTGVFLFEELTKMSASKGWRVFLLGGWDNVSEEASRMLVKRFPRIKIDYDAGEKQVGMDPETDKRVVEKINRFKPDILFVSYNPVKQEKWIASHMSNLKVGIAVGVGGTYNEYLGRFPLAPKWMEKSGLKWLWRVWVEPKRLGRILRAVIVFPWLVFWENVSIP